MLEWMLVLGSVAKLTRAWSWSVGVGSQSLRLRRRVVTRLGSQAMTGEAGGEKVDEALGPFKSSFVSEFVARGYLHQCTDLAYLDAEMSDGAVAAYLGFDATADSLHVGSLLQIMILRLLQKHGHKPVVLIGGGTTKVGDPSGKDEARKMLTDDVIEANVDGITKIFETFLAFDDDAAAVERAVIVNNKDWLESLGYVEFLRDYGGYFSVNRMLTFDSVKTRLAREQPLSFLEFNYMILQAYDFYELHRRYDVLLQLGGSDQWGNIVSGVELTRRAANAKVVGLTAPLVTTADGRKMGKTADGAVWLSAAKLPPYDYWQFWRNVADDDVKRFLKLFTELPVLDIDALPFDDAPAINGAKRLLADEATSLLHGPTVLPQIHSAVDALFTGQGTDVSQLPTLALTSDDFDGDAIPVVDLLIKLDFVKSKNEARRLIQGGGARIQDVKILDIAAVVQRTSVLDADNALKVSSGKKKHAIVTIASD